MKNFLLPLIVLIAAVAIFFSLSRPLLADIAVLRLEKAKLETGLDNARKLQEVRDELIKISREFPKEDLDRLNKMLPDNVDNVRLIIDINNLARGSGMSIRNIKIKSDQGGTDPQVIADSGQKKGAVTLAFSVAGPYANFEDFLQRLARSLRLVDVTDVSFSSNEKNFYEYSVELQTYWLK
ncbi:type 4a pilus biogenesis protein PilO [Candidatus Nomurabacteria bacterium]|nr:type 4a pilus biogenesis protein PilO [Candidatus Nomurabacteria bacterium]